ncbi:MAG TPA: acetaldehyde dehydrogenase (acetylating) [Patescibacteria group bacterium]|nr:acetaldehyde dehydrogenase (acetylating) [Patescibacteria group bacterium]
MESGSKTAQRARCAILGSGNIGTDLMVKLMRSEILEVVAMAGIDPASEGLARARQAGLKVFEDGIDGLLTMRPLPQIVFDATSARAHLAHAPRLKQAGIVAIDLTPAAVGDYVVPAVNLDERVGASNVNLVTCGGQATIPIVAAVSRVAPVEYAEIVATIASASAGPGTRQNIDEFTETTARGLERLGGARRGKAIIVLNPADPPIMMRDTIYVRYGAGASQEEITASIRRMVREIQQYVPGYRLRAEPLFEEDQVTVMIEVEGAGDFLPRYSGNLDIMTAAAVRVGEEAARNLMRSGAAGGSR